MRNWVVPPPPVRARITWTHPPPLRTRCVMLSRFDDNPRGWSLVLHDLVPGADVTSAEVNFLVEAAPHDRLTPGARLTLLYGPHAVGVVEVL